jgi:Kef-type K+ transport system membrane component KefB
VNPSASGVGEAFARSGVVLRAILGLLALLALAYLGGHPRVRRWEERLKISQVITAGFPFVLLGVVARLPTVGVLSDPLLAELSPLLHLGLGWIGFVVGFRFDVRLIGRLPTGVASAVVWWTMIPFAMVVLATGGVLLAWTHPLSSVGLAEATVGDPAFVRDAIVLGTTGAITSWIVVRRLPRTGATPALRHLVRIEELAGIVGLTVVAAYFRPHTPAAWQLPGTAWLFLTIGFGVFVGALVYAMLQQTPHPAELTVLTLGSVALAAGVAGYLHLSPVVVAFVAGAFVGNFPGAYKDRVADTLLRLERPIYLLSLVVIGALWRYRDPLGWVLAPVFVCARLAGRSIGIAAGLRRASLTLEPQERQALVIAPIGELALAIVVNAQLLYPDGNVGAIVSAVLAASVFSEVLVQIVLRRPPAAPEPPDVRPSTSEILLTPGPVPLGEEPS